MDISQYKVKMQAAVARLEDELKKVRTGRAHPSIIEGIMVESYGQMMPLNQVANINAPEAQLLQITPFDPSNLQAIVTAIRNDQGLGLNPADDGRVVRVPMPPLTEDRRRQIVKSLGDTVEEARVSLRSIRRDAIKDAKAKKESKEFSDDDVKGTEKLVTEMIGEFNQRIDTAFKQKEAELISI